MMEQLAYYRCHLHEHYQKCFSASNPIREAVLVFGDTRTARTQSQTMIQWGQTTVATDE